MPIANNWEWSAEEIRRVGYRVVDFIAEYLTTLPDKPVFQPYPSDLAEKHLSSSVPRTGESADEILDAFANDIATFPFGNGHPRFYGWVNSPPVLMGIFADALAAAMNPSCAGGNHAAIYIEREVINWFKEVLGFPSTSMGLLVSGGSMAALTALATARHAKCGFNIRETGVQGTNSSLIFYRSGEEHGCHQKAIELMGIGSHNLRTVSHDAAMRMTPSALDAAIQKDKEEGRLPIAVIASAGTVNTGAIDPLSEIADICEKHSVWLHVDGAYGAPSILSTKYKNELSALSRADSVAIDPHKWLYVPVEAGFVLVRDGETMRSAFSLIPPYLRTQSKVGGLPWFSEYGFQQTRGFRALKVWMALRYHGTAGYQSAIENDIQHAEVLASLIRNNNNFELFEPQSLSIVCFRYVPANLRKDLEAVNSLNKAILEKVQLGGDTFLSSAVIEGRFWLRACIINPRARVEDIRKVPAFVSAAAQSIKGEP